MENPNRNVKPGDRVCRIGPGSAPKGLHGTLIRRVDHSSQDERWIVFGADGQVYTEEGGRAWGSDSFELVYAIGPDEPYVIPAGFFQPVMHYRQKVMTKVEILWTPELPSAEDLCLVVVRNQKKPEPRYYAGSGKFCRFVYDRTNPSWEVEFPNEDEEAQEYADWKNAQEAEK